MSQVAQIKKDIAKMIDAGAPESDIDAYIAANDLTVDDLNRTSVGQDIGAAVKGLALGAGKMALGAIQAKDEALGAPDFVGKIYKNIGSSLENESIENKKRNPVIGTVSELAPSLPIMIGMGASLPAMVGGSAILSAMSPKTNPETVQQSEGTAFERALRPAGEASSALVGAAGIDPQSRLGMGAQGALFGAASYGAGKGLGKAGQAANKGAKALTRGLTKIDQEAIKTLTESGIDPTLYLTTNSKALMGISDTMRKLPLIGGRLDDTAERAITKLTSNVDDAAARLGTATDKIEGGQAIQSGLNKFTDRTGKTIASNYQKVDDLIPPNTPAVTQNLQDFSNQYVGNASANPLAASVAEGDVLGLSRAAQKTTEVPYETLKKVRSKVGEKSGRMDAPSEYKQIYGALSKDMEATAQGVSPEAAQAASRANNYYRAVTQRSEKLKRFFAQNQDGTYIMPPEKAAQASRSELALLKKTIPRADFDDYVSSVVRKLGEAPAGVQNATGDVFSPNTFLTSYNKLMQSKKADVMFDSATKTQLDRAAKVAERFKQMGKQANVSNTTNSAAQVGAFYTLFVKPAKALTAASAGYGFERLLTSPKMLKVINDYAYKPVVKSNKVRGEFSSRLLQAAGQDADLQQIAQEYVGSLNGEAE